MLRKNEPTPAPRRILHAGLATVVAAVCAALLVTTLIVLISAVTGSTPWLGIDPPPLHSNLTSGQSEFDWAALIIRALLVIVALLLAIAACALSIATDLMGLVRSALTGEGLIEYGEVIGKNHSDPYTSLMPVQTSTGPNSSITTMIPMHHPESWSITFQGASSAGISRVRTVSVDEDVYEATEIGSPWPPESDHRTQGHRPRRTDS